MLRKAAFTGSQSQLRYVYFKLVSFFFRKENVVIHFSSKMERDELVSGLHPYMYVICICMMLTNKLFRIFKFWKCCFCFSFNALLGTFLLLLINV